VKRQERAQQKGMDLSTGRHSRQLPGDGGARRSSGRALAVRAALACALLSCALAGAGTAAGQPGAHASLEPFAAQGPKLVPSDEIGHGHFGRSVSLSADGNTALVGGPHDSGEVGSAWIYTRTGSTWSEQARLSVGKTEGSSYFGRGVALSADGNTALVGDPGNGSNAGDAWIFTRSGSTWTLQQRLSGAGEEIGAGQFGRSVALSADGAVALVGAYFDNTATGAAWAYVREGATFKQLGSKLTAHDEVGAGTFGRSVSLSADGTVALIGGNRDDHVLGAVWTFASTGGAFEQQGAKLTVEDEIGKGQFGSAAALSDDGRTAIVGASEDDSGAGAAWVFSRSGSLWERQSGKLTGGGEVGAGLFGYSVAISGDAASALVGAYADGERAGASWVFVHPGDEWEQQGPKLTAYEALGEGRFGFGVALSRAGDTAIVCGIGDDEGVGAAWPFARPAVSEPPLKTPGPPEQNPETPASTASGTPAPTGSVGVLSTTTSTAPVLGVSGDIEPVSGMVFVRLPHSNVLVPLTGLRQVPFGTLIDATGGRVRVTTALPHEKAETGEFFAGEFVLGQRSSGVVTARLTGGDLGGCRAVRHGARRKGRHASASAKRRGRRLWANAHGTFTTQGHYAAGAVQGTEWLTEDRCDGTLIRVTRDKVLVTDLVHHRRFTVRAGHKVLVHRP
jgi:hypothetical protein